ncbi:hypothetical protein FOA52_008883 [Chlamydomonas sp. UWO 241]|nr:hypothetical protein FOA52_008883 [Chlamydomonas sp. UWO 241]
MAAAQLEVVDLTPLAGCAGRQGLLDDEEAQRLCRAVSNSLRSTGCAIIKHPAVSTRDNDGFINMMESYFAQGHDAKMADVRPELHYQVGATPAYVETPRILFDASMRERADALPDSEKPTMPEGPDPKCRFFWRIGERPTSSAFSELNAEPVVPAAFPQWRGVMDGWGGRMLTVANDVAAAASVGLGLAPDALTSLMDKGPHLLAPTGSDLSGELATVGRVFAGYHYDLNFLTLHGRSRFPGLFVWLRDGRRVAVRVPEGCLFVQAGKQLEWLTAGEVMAGMHEVVVTDDTLRAVDVARSAGRPTWRVSSTVFSHVASDNMLQPLGPFAASPAAAQYPPILTGAQVSAELAAIKLRKHSAAAACAEATEGGAAAAAAPPAAAAAAPLTAAAAAACAEATDGGAAAAAAPPAAAAAAPPTAAAIAATAAVAAVAAAAAAAAAADAAAGAAADAAAGAADAVTAAAAAAAAAADASTAAAAASAAATAAAAAAAGVPAGASGAGVGAPQSGVRREPPQAKAAAQLAAAGGFDSAQHIDQGAQ